MLRRLALAYLVLGLVLAALPAVGEEVPLRILVTNDDGYRAKGLLTLVAELTTLGEVVVAAPRENMSGSSQSMGGFGGELQAETVTIPGAREAWAVNSTPAAAAAFGVLYLGTERPFDLVVSGINRGANVGDISHLSGTVGAAMQAVYLGVPAIAVSQDAAAADYGAAARYTVKLVRALKERGFPRGIVVSINVPAAATQGGSAEAVVAPMGGSYVHIDAYEKLPGEGTVALFRARVKLEGKGVPAFQGTDTGAYLDGKITVTPLRFDWTDQRLVASMSQWLPQPGAD